MYGYVRPEKGELKIREYELFRGVYCGLCHTLKKRYGMLFRFAVNYDLTFLSMLLCSAEKPELCIRRCPYHPMRRSACPKTYPAMEAAADYTVILAWWKMLDGVKDKGFFGALASRLVSVFMKPAYRKAASTRPEFAHATEDNLRMLWDLEDEKSGRLDEAADKFACILRAASDDVDDTARKRILNELLYHLGRIVYVIDAVDDLKKDEQDGVYNPLSYRFSTQNGNLLPEDVSSLRQTLQHSHNSLCAAFELLGDNPYREILSNIIYFGLPGVTQAVFSGTWRKPRRAERERSKIV